MYVHTHKCVHAPANILVNTICCIICYLITICTALKICYGDKTACISLTPDHNKFLPALAPMIPTHSTLHNNDAFMKADSRCLMYCK